MVSTKSLAAETGRNMMHIVISVMIMPISFLLLPPGETIDNIAPTTQAQQTAVAHSQKKKKKSPSFYFKRNAA